MDFKKRVNGAWTNTPIYEYGDGEYSGTVPATLLTNGVPISSGVIEGNMNQASGVSPTTPIIPQECGEKTGNVMPAGEQKTVTNNGITFVSDGNGRYHVYGTATEYASAIFNLETGFTTPISISNGGQGTLSLFNSQATSSVTLIFYNQGTKVDDWKATPQNCTHTAYNAVGGKYVDRIRIDVSSGATIDMTIAPEFTNDGVLPSEFEPHGYKLDISSGGENLLDLSKIVAGRLMSDTGEVAYAAQTTYLSVSGDSVTVTTSSTWRGFVSDYIPTEDRLRGTIGSLSNVSDNVTLTGYYFYYDKGKNYLGSGNAVPEGTKYVRISFQFNTSVELAVASNIMVNRGSTPLPYSPYNRSKTPVYLGEVETERKIKKLICDGSETWAITTSGRMYRTISDKANNTPLCTHFKGSSAQSYVAVDDGCVSMNIGNYIVFYKSDITTPEAWKEYLAAQYANGTPVCVWYVLATPTTGILNEPLRKIGNYADSLSVSQTIPTVEGSNVVDVETTLKPSEVQLEYEGWHEITPHIYPDTTWLPTSWSEFRDVVRAGKAPDVYPVGTKLYENWGDETSDAWVIVDYPTGQEYLDSDLAQQGFTNRVMLMEEKILNLRVFDNAEAWLYAETAIPAGVYRFTIPNYDTAYGGNKTYIFTSTANVPVGGQLTLTWAYQQNLSAVQAYSSATSTSALFNVSIAEWDGTTSCVDLGTIKLAMADADSAYGKLNHIHRARYGSNNYAQSGIRQWLNADATANNWWQPTTIFDRPYGNRSAAGRLNTLNSNMKAVLATPTIDCITNNLYEYPSLDGTTFALQTQYSLKDKLFLATHTEVNLSSSPNVGSVLDYYVGKGNADRIKYRKDNGNAYYFWLRPPYPSLAYHSRTVTSSGALGSSNALSSLGGVSACIIQ